MSQYRKAIVAAVGAVLQVLAVTLGGTAGQVAAVLLAAGTVYGVWAAPNVPAAKTPQLPLD
jgi:hypothetical protein